MIQIILFGSDQSLRRQDHGSVPTVQDMQSVLETGADVLVDVGAETEIDT